MRKINLFLILSLLFSFAAAQEVNHCATMQKIDFFSGVTNSSKRSVSSLQSRTTKATSKDAHKVLIVPVVVHILYRTPEQNIGDDVVKTQLNVLNKDFRRNNSDTSDTPSPFKGLAADCEIEFCLAKQDPSGNATSGITRTQTSVAEIGNKEFYLTSQGGEDCWDRNSYLNIWVCEIELNGSLLGFSPLPSFHPLRERDGVVIDYRYFGRSANTRYNKGRTCTHEVGHWFDLYHIWGDDGGLCIGTDSVHDTPNQTVEHYGKPFFPALDSCTLSFPGTMYMNFLDYTDDAGMNMFSKGQKQRMWNALNYTFRDSLQQSKGCIPVSSVDDQILVYPNPFVDYFRIHFYLSTPQNYTIKVYDIFGRIVMENFLEGTQVASETVDFSKFPGGVYVLQIKSSQKEVVKKIIKN